MDLLTNTFKDANLNVRPKRGSHLKGKNIHSEPGLESKTGVSVAPQKQLIS